MPPTWGLKVAVCTAVETPMHPGGIWWAAVIQMTAAVAKSEN